MIPISKLMFRCLPPGLSLLLAFVPTDSRSQATEPQSQPVQTSPSQLKAPAPAVGTIHGVVKSGNMPIPGAGVSISTASSAGTITTWTDVDGSYSAPVPAYGSYTVQIQMTAFAKSAQDVVVDASHQDVQANFELTLLSRTREATP